MKPTLVTTTWCGPCKIVKAFLQENPKDILILDAEDNTEFCKTNGIRSVPTLVIESGKLSGSDDIIKHLSSM